MTADATRTMDVAAMDVAAVAGGVGAARMLRGVLAVVDPARVTAIVNTGDDMVLHGLSISPDLDTVVYTLAEAVNPETGWGLVGETWAAMSQLERYGGQTWFRLGDRDLATHLFRTQRMAEGAPLSQVTDEVAKAWGLALHVLPMTDQQVRTRVTLAATGTEIGFQEWFVGHRHAPPVAGVRFTDVEQARPAPGVLEALGAAGRVVVCPSNPIVSIGPVLAVPGVREALEARRDDTVAVSPLVAGAALKGPAAQMMTDLGHDASVVGIARLYAPFAATLVVDEADADLADEVESEGLRCIVAPTVMHGPAEAAALARVVLSLDASHDGGVDAP